MRMGKTRSAMPTNSTRPSYPSENFSMDKTRSMPPQRGVPSANTAFPAKLAPSSGSARSSHRGWTQGSSAEARHAFPRHADEGVPVQHAFNASLVADRIRTTAEFQELYREHAAQIEAQAHDRIREEAKMQVAEVRQAMCAAGSDQRILKAAQARVNPEITTLEGELMQEVVLADQLQASEEAREAQLRQLQSQRPRAAARPPKLGEKSALTFGSEELQSELQQERASIQQLEQRAWREQNAVRASEAHEDLLKAHRKDLDRKLNEMQSQMSWVTPSASAPAGVVAEARQLPSLQQQEMGLAEHAREGTHEELAAQQLIVRLQRVIQDLESDVGALWLDSSVGSGAGASEQEASHIHASLVAALPPLLGASGAHPPTLDLLVERLDAQRQVTYEELQIDAQRGNGWQAREEDRLERIAKEIARLHAEAEASSEEALRFQAEAKQLSHTQADDVDDRLCESADLRRENDVMRRQQAQWQKSQLRMLRLIEDMQRKRCRDVQSQATVAARLSELQKELPLHELCSEASSDATKRSSALNYPRSPSPPKIRHLLGSPGESELPPNGGSRLDSIWSDNVAMQSKLRLLEEEREELIRSQQSLIHMVKSKMPTIEQARSRMRMAHAVGEPHFAGRRAGF